MSAATNRGSFHDGANSSMLSKKVVVVGNSGSSRIVFPKRVHAIGFFLLMQELGRLLWYSDMFKIISMAICQRRLAGPSSPRRCTPSLSGRRVRSLPHDLCCLQSAQHCGQHANKPADLGHSWPGEVIVALAHHWCIHTRERASVAGSARWCAYITAARRRPCSCST